jgi:hypothetical protein
MRGLDDDAPAAAGPPACEVGATESTPPPDAFARLVTATRQGETTDLSPDLSSDDIEALEDDEWKPEQSVKADCIRRVATLHELRPDPRGLTIRGALITDRLDLSCCDVPCQLRFVDCRFDDTPDLTGTSVRTVVLNRCYMPGIVLTNAQVEGDVTCDGTVVDGDVKASGLRTKGSVSLTGTRFLSGAELEFRLARIEGDLILRDAEIDGALELRGAHVTGRTFLSGSTFAERADDALSAEALETETLNLRGCTTSGRPLNLANAQIGSLTLSDLRDVDPPDAVLPGPLTAPGWVIQDIYGSIRTDRRLMARWLDTNRETDRPFTPQPWHAVADVCERNGQHADARWLRFQAARRTTRAARLSSKPVRHLYGAFSGYGYYPLVAALWILVALVVVTAIVADNRQHFSPARVTAPTPAALTTADENGARSRAAFHGGANCSDIAPYPCLRPSLYALDTVLPTVSTGQAEAWRPNPTQGDVLARSWLPWTLTALKAFGWALAAILLAGLTGLLRRT